MGDFSRRQPRPLAPNELRPTPSATPSGPITQEIRDPRSTRPKRAVVHVACLACRRLRVKCDGNRPTCTPCSKRDDTCEYDVEANTTRTNALKRKNEDLSEEVAQLRELYSFLHDRPQIEAEEIFRRIRNTTEPLDVLHHVRSADLLIARKTSKKPPLVDGEVDEAMEELHAQGLIDSDRSKSR